MKEVKMKQRIEKSDDCIDKYRTFSNKQKINNTILNAGNGCFGFDESGQIGIFFGNQKKKRRLFGAPE